MKRILIYSHDTYGLGNIRRMLNIAESIQSEFSDASILLLSGSPMIHAFRLTAGMDYVKLPCLTRDASESYKPKSLGISKNCILKLRAELIQSTVLSFEPDLILVDKKPLGVGGELAPTLEKLQRLEERPKMVLILRDILDKPEETISVWANNRYHDVLHAIYDRILVLGSADVFNAVEEYAFPPASAEKTFFCGYTNRSAPQRSVSEVREEIGINGGRLVLVTTGGGEDGANLVRVALNTVKQFGSGFADHCHVFLGPEMPEPQADHFRSLSAALPSVSMQSFSSDFVSYLDAADAVVAMGGYNTVTEILSRTLPAVIVPRTKPVSEQQIRATGLERLGLIKSLSPENLRPEELLRAVTDAIEQRHSAARARVNLNLGALQKVANHVGNLLGDSRAERKLFRNDHTRLNGAGRSQVANGPVKPLIDELVPLAAGNS